MAVVDERIPAGMVRCDWQSRGKTDWRLVLLAQDRRNLPIDLRSCKLRQRRPAMGLIESRAGGEIFRSEV